MLKLLFPGVVLLVGCAEATSTSASRPHIDVEAPQLWAQVAGQGDPTVVFEAGESDDSSVWAATEAAIRLPNGVRTVLFDRAGLGNSSAMPGPYRIDDEAAALKRALDRFAIRGPIVLVAHSYSGLVATLMAATDSHVVGVVLVDAYVGEMFDDTAASRLVAKATPEVDALERTKPELAHALRPLIRAFPESARRVRSVKFPPALPTIDIVAEKSSGSDDDRAAMQRAHAAFVAGSPEREQVMATGSGHYVMRDRPDLVNDAIARMVRRARGQ